jgi:hypothetical protein
LESRKKARFFFEEEGVKTFLHVNLTRHWRTFQTGTKRPQVVGLPLHPDPVDPPLKPQWHAIPVDLLGLGPLRLNPCSTHRLTLCASPDPHICLGTAPFPANCLSSSPSPSLAVPQSLTTSQHPSCPRHPCLVPSHAGPTGQQLHFSSCKEQDLLSPL